MTIAFNPQRRSKTSPVVGFGVAVEAEAENKYLHNLGKMKHQRAKKCQSELEQIKNFTEDNAEYARLTFIPKTSANGNRFSLEYNSEEHVFQKSSPDKPPKPDEVKAAHYLLKLKNENKISPDMSAKLLKAIQGTVL